MTHDVEFKMSMWNFNYKLCNIISYFLWHFNTEENSVELTVLALIKMIQYFVKLCVRPVVLNRGTAAH